MSNTSYFSVDQDGGVYQLAFLQKAVDQAVLVYNKDGSYKRSIKLEFPPGVRDLIPHQIAAFPSGDLLIAASTFDPETRVSSPFTGLFGPDGGFKKEVKLSDDPELQKMAESQDPHVIASGHPFQNRADGSGAGGLRSRRQMFT